MHSGALVVFLTNYLMLVNAMHTAAEHTEWRPESSAKQEKNLHYDRILNTTCVCRCSVGRKLLFYMINLCIHETLW